MVSNISCHIFESIADPLQPNSPKGNLPDGMRLCQGRRIKYSQLLHNNHNFWIFRLYLYLPKMILTPQRSLKSNAASIESHNISLYLLTLLRAFFFVIMYQNFLGCLSIAQYHNSHKGIKQKCLLLFRKKIRRLLVGKM